jgi:DNA-binding winged helix-turn-helix (wHTH) protein/tetratricopeptide (TPR) repeat protein
MAGRNAAANAEGKPNPVRLRFDVFDLDEANASLLREGKPVAVAPTPFAVLCALVRQPGSLLTKHALLDQVWGHQFVSDSVLKTAISDLRTLLADDPRQPRFIETVSRRGYRFVAKTSVIPVAMPPPTLGPTRAPLPTFVSRANELARLQNAWEMATGGTRTVAWVVGEPGIGKTTLIEYFVAQLGDITCARGQCVENFGTGEPYLPVLEAMADLCRRDKALPELLRTVAPTWLLQLPWLSTSQERDALQRELAGVSPDRMLREMGELLDRYSAQQPLLLVTEDLQWSDRSTLQLIEYLARRRGSARLMWLGSFRLTDVVALDHPLNRLRRELKLHRLCEEIVLDSFSEAEVASYVAEMAGPLAGDEAFVRTLHERTDGVPLFVASVLREVVGRSEQDTGDRRDAVQLVSVALPENLTAIIDHYIARLRNDQRELLEAAAVCGVEFRVSPVAEALERDAAIVAHAFEELEQEQVWLVPPRVDTGSVGREQLYAFRHGLFRRALYEKTGPHVRIRLHRTVGIALEREHAAGLPVAVTELATHFERGGEPLPALRYYALAAEAALANLSPGECMDLTAHGLNILAQAPDGTERKAIDITLSTLRGIAAFHILGVGEEAKSAFRRAYTLLPEASQHPMRGRLLHGLGWVLALRADYDEAIEVAKQTEALSSATNDSVLMLAASFIHANVLQLQGQSRAALSWIERGIGIAERSETPSGQIFVSDPLVTLLGLFGIELLYFGRVREAHERIERAYARARMLGQPMSRLVAMWFDALFEVRLANVQRVAELARDMCALVDEYALAQGRAAARWFRGWAEAHMGNPREGHRLIHEAYEEIAQLGMLAGGSEVRAYAAEALLLAEDWEAAQTQIDEALQFANTHGERVYLPQLYQMEATVARARGEPAAAKTSLRRAITEARAQESLWHELLALTDLCEHALASTDDRRALAALLDRLPNADGTAAVAKARSLLGQ